MKQYYIVDENIIFGGSNTLEEIEKKRKEYIQDLIDEGTSYSEINIVSKIEKGDEEEYNRAILIADESSKDDPDFVIITHNHGAYDKDIDVDKNEAWYGVII